jgi:hypothetical protein
MTRATGIDISKWQGAYLPTKTPPQPVDFVIQRLSYCMTKDEKIKELSTPALQAPMTGAYHYPSSGAGWKDQCDFFLSLMNNVYDFWAWDVEKLFNTNSSGFIGGIVPALKYLSDHSGKPGLLYVNPDVWGTWFQPIQAELLDVFKPYPGLPPIDLWVSHYWTKLTDRKPEATPNYWTVRGAENMPHDWRFWQYDDKGMVNRGKEFGVQSFGLDIDVFNGTVDDLWKWAHPASEQSAPATKPCPMCGGTGKVPA